MLAGLLLVHQFSHQILAEHVVGLAGTGFESGTPMAHYELHA